MRKRYLDWLRGVAVAVMVLAHVTDAWTLDADKASAFYFNVVFVSGLAAPLFLFLAGLTLALAASSRALTVGHAAAAARARRHGWQIFALAFVFRLQSQLLGWGAFSNFLKVDILNVMGLAMVAAGVLWSVSASRAARVTAFAAATAAATFLTPLVREWAGLAILPDPVEAYLRPQAGRTTFALFPWAGFLFAGALAGELVSAARTRAGELRLQAGLLVAGVAGIGLGYWASWQPSIYAVSHFWTSSPTFFFIRLGIATAMMPLAFAVTALQDAAHRRWAWRLLPDVVATLGRSSLFVYWIHVEMVYGVLGRPVRRALPIEASLTATVVLCLLLYAIVVAKNRMVADLKLAGPLRLMAPVLK